jgi:hypothetical protein
MVKAFLRGNGHTSRETGALLSQLGKQVPKPAG